jgi:hypothetical protein
MNDIEPGNLVMVGNTVFFRNRRLPPKGGRVLGSRAGGG